MQAQARTAVAQSHAPTSTPVPPTAAPTATPALATIPLRFGSAGTGPGLFQDARSIALDRTGHIYVADHVGGRVQVFDMNGKFQTQFQVGNAKTVISALAADRKGTVYISSDGDILRYEGASGKLLGKLPNPGGSGYGDIVLRADGGLLAMWYADRSGFISPQVSHRDDLVQFDSTGKVLHTYSNFIGGQIDDLAFDTHLGVDGLGNILAVDAYTTNLVYKFTPEGKFVTRLFSVGSKPGQIYGTHTIAIDGKGHIYIADSNGIDVFDSNAGYIGLLDREGWTYAMAFDDDGALWTVTGAEVRKHTLNFK